MEFLIQFQSVQNKSISPLRDAQTGRNAISTFTKAKEILKSHTSYHTEKNKSIHQMGPSLSFFETENEHVTLEQVRCFHQVTPHLSENSHLIQLPIVHVGGA